MAVPATRILCLSLLALFAASCSDGFCEDLECYQPNPCGEDPDCGWTGLGAETLTVPTPPRTGEILLLDGTVQARTFAFKTVPGRIYTFTCTAEGFEACQVDLYNAEYHQAFVQQEGRTTRVHFAASADEAVAMASVKPLPAGITGTFQYALAERSDDHGPSVAQATHLTPDGAAVVGALQEGPDTDTFTFDLQAGHAFTVRCQGAFTSSVQGTLSGPDGAAMGGNEIGRASCRERVL